MEERATAEAFLGEDMFLPQVKSTEQVTHKIGFWEWLSKSSLPSLLFHPPPLVARGDIQGSARDWGAPAIC